MFLVHAKGQHCCGNILRNVPQQCYLIVQVAGAFSRLIKYKYGTQSLINFRSISYLAFTKFKGFHWVIRSWKNFSSTTVFSFG